MATDLREELRRLQNVVLKLSAEIGGKNQKLEYLEKMLGERSTSLSRMTEERDHLNEAYNEEKGKMKRTMYENDRLMRELETQRKEIEQQAKEIKKRDAQLDFKSKQLLVLRNLNNATKVSRKRNSVQRKPEGVKHVITQDKVQVQIDTNGLHKVQVQIDTNGLHNELEEKGYELDTELNRKQTLADKEHRSNHDLQEAPKVPIEEAKNEDDEKSIELLDEWGKGDIEGSGGVGCNVFQDMFPPIPPPESLVDPCNDMPNNSSDLSSVLAVPDDELAELEWSSTLVENSLFNLDIDFSNNNKKDDSHLFCTSNPVSVLKNISSCSDEKTMPLSPDTVVPRRVRSKRPRSAIFNQLPARNLVSLKPCTVNVQNLPMSNSYIVSESGYFAKSLPPYTPKCNGKQQKKKIEKKRLPPSLPSYSSDHDNPLQQQQQPGVSVQPYTPKFNGKEQKKKKGKKRVPPSLPSYSSDHDNPLQQQQQPGVAEQKCLHCEITKTPQWREGPMGPKTLCNACGVRYRSGRLFPEYRPAASPTFVASIHSNSHRKVLEMMNVKGTPER